MAHYLPPAIMRFFQPRPPVEYKPAIVKRKMPPLIGIAQFVVRFKDEVPMPVKRETPKQQREERKKKKQKIVKERLKRQFERWDPKKNAKGVTSDAYKTLFVGRLSYDVTEEDLKSEFEYYGNIVKVYVIYDRKGKSRGYAFVEFESSRDLKEAYKDADGRKINGRRILVDVERGRTVKNWKPRRLGGGLGATRRGGKSENQKYSGREPPRSSHDRRSDRDRRSRDRGRDRERDRDRKRDRSRRDDRNGDRDRDRSRRRDR